jgi:hypothetical protein
MSNESRTNAHGHKNYTQWIHVIYIEVETMDMKNTQWIHANVDHSHKWIHNGAMSQNKIRGYLEPMK